MENTPNTDEVSKLLRRYCRPDWPVAEAGPLTTRPERYLLFVLAPWSAPSIRALVAFGRDAYERPTADPRLMFVVHIDDVHAEPLLREHSFHGWGECFEVDGERVKRMRNHARIHGGA